MMSAPCASLPNISRGGRRWCRAHAASNTQLFSPRPSASAPCSVGGFRKLGRRRHRRRRRRQTRGPKLSDACPSRRVRDFFGQSVGRVRDGDAAVGPWWEEKKISDRVRAIRSWSAAAASVVGAPSAVRWKKYSHLGRRASRKTAAPEAAAVAFVAADFDDRLTRRRRRRMVVFAAASATDAPRRREVATRILAREVRRRRRRRRRRRACRGQ
jgi:hypothetical protein